MTANPLVRMVDHLAWADAQVAAALRDTPDPEALTLYAHVLGAEHRWITRIASETPQTAVWPDLDLDACERVAAENHARLRGIVRGADADAFARDVAYVNSAGADFRSSVSDVLVHVCLHGQHHRGQIAARLRAAGARPPSLDYIAWARGAPAATRADRG